MLKLVNKLFFIFMFYSEKNKLIINVFKKSKLFCFKNNLVILKLFKNKKFFITRGVFLKYIYVQPEMFGLKFGMYISTRKLYNKYLFMKKKKR